MILLLPFSDYPNVRGIPYVTLGLIVVHLAVLAFVGVIPFEEAIESTGPWTVEFERPRITPADPGLLPSLFMHENWLAAAFSVLYLYLFGDNVELHVGRARYVLLYCVGGALCGLLGAQLTEQPALASTGATCCILGAYAGFFRHSEIRIASLWARDGGTTFFSAWTGIAISLTLLLGVSLPEVGLPGFALGVVGALLLANGEPHPDTGLGAAGYPAPLPLSEPPVAKIRAALESDDLPGAALLYLQSRKRLDGQLDAEELERLGQWMESNGMEYAARIPRSAARGL